MDVAVQLLQIFMGGPFLIYVVLSLFCSDAPTAIIFWFAPCLVSAGSDQCVVTSVFPLGVPNMVAIRFLSAPALFCSSEFRGLWPPQEPSWQAP